MSSVTNEQAQQTYQAARAALRKIAFSFDATDAQIEVARWAMTDLATSYMDRIIEDVEARNAQFRRFIADMNAVIEAMGSGGAMQAINQLTGIVATATALVGAATGETDTGPTARAFAARPMTVDSVSPYLIEQVSPTQVIARRADGDDSWPIIRIFAVHGVGQHAADRSWQIAWARAMARGILHWQPDAQLHVRYMMYDDQFARLNISAADVLVAATKLLASGIWHGIGDLFTRKRGLDELSYRVRWTAGMVVQWAENDALRANLRAQFENEIREYDQGAGPDIIAAHSLGSLVSYDTLAFDLTQKGHPNAADHAFRRRIAGAHLVTFGSQVGNPFVRSTFAGRINELTNICHWHHLYNRHDDVLTARVRLSADRFSEIDTPFDLEGVGDHDASEYLAHPAARDAVWQAIADPDHRALTNCAKIFNIATQRRVEKRALLVGINDYPDPQMRLEGCVNDVFLVSSVLQEVGFKPDNIRVALDDRATTDGIRNRLDWLLDGVQAGSSDDKNDGDHRVFYFSGHGAQLSGYGIGETIDRLDECLVPHDFDWSRRHAIIDDELYELYSQLPYSATLLMVLDCCHSGGMTRDGATRVRGINAPDDIRHRTMKWNTAEKMWEPRKLDERDTTDKAQAKLRQALKSADDPVHRLGRSASLRTHDREQIKKEAKRWDHRGPFMPVIYQACQENEYAYEYRHGVSSYGAFTYALAHELRAALARRQVPTFGGLVDKVATKLKVLGYQQTPRTDGPAAVLADKMPITLPPTRKPRKKR